MIYVCIPAHDEARTVGVLLWKVRRVMAGFGRDYRILVLDDASTDDTSEVLDRYRKALPLTVLRTETRIGHPAAVERLLREAAEQSAYPKRDCAVVLQADFTEDPAGIEALVKTIEGGADIVAGVPERPGPAAPRGFAWARRVAPWVLGRAHGEAPVTDPLCGFRAYRVIVLRKALRDRAEPLATRHGWAGNLEILGNLAPHARRIEEAPLEVRYELQTRESRFRPWHALRDLLALRGAVGWNAEPEQAA